MRWPWERRRTPTRLVHEHWCDTQMDCAAYWAAEGLPFDCNCDEYGPGSMRAVLLAYEEFRATDRDMQIRLGIEYHPLPPAEEVMQRRSELIADDSRPTRKDCDYGR